MPQNVKHRYGIWVVSSDQLDSLIEEPGVAHHQALETYWFDEDPRESRWTRTALPRGLQLRIRHRDVPDTEEVLVTVRRASEVVSAGLVPFHDDDWWSQGLPS